MFAPSSMAMGPRASPSLREGEGETSLEGI